MSRFDYVKYDEKSQLQQAKMKAVVEAVEREIDAHLMPGCQKQEALKALEVCYMWCGKAIRDNQIMRNGGAELQEERTDDRVCL